jgi:hypothetical protein
MKSRALLILFDQVPSGQRKSNVRGFCTRTFKFSLHSRRGSHRCGSFAAITRTVSANRALPARTEGLVGLLASEKQRLRGGRLSRTAPYLSSAVFPVRKHMGFSPQPKL